MTAKRTSQAISALHEIDRVAEREHFVQFFDADQDLIEGVARFLNVGFAQGGLGIVIATKAHRVALERKLFEQGFDVAALRDSGRYSPLDARETLASFMANGRPDPRRFRAVLGSWMEAHNGYKIRAFGEMVALLWADGNQTAAIELENLWNELGQIHEFTLYCAYPSTVGSELAQHNSFLHVCRAHSTVIKAGLPLTAAFLPPQRP